MNDSEPLPIVCSRPPLGDRIPLAGCDLTGRTEEELAAIDRALDDPGTADGVLNHADAISAAFSEELFHQRQASMSWAIRRAGVVHQADIDDATQDAWVKLLERGKDGTSPRHENAWLATVARNNAINQARRNREKPHDRDLFDGFVARPIVGPLDGIEEVIDSLSPDLRDVVISKFVEDRTAEETAALLKISESTVNRRIAQGRSILWERLLDWADPRPRGPR